MGGPSPSSQEPSNTWADFPTELIDCIISVLHSTHRWCIDGRSLRELNRHWCQHLSQLIHTVQPHKNRVLAPTDVTSLLHFPCITSLTPRSFFRFSGGNGGSVLEALTGLQHLTHLDVDAYDAQYAFRTSNLSQLTGITSLCIRQRWDKDAFNGTALTALSHLPLKALTIQCHIHSLEAFLDCFNELEYLSIMQPVDDISLLKLDRYQALQSLRLHVDGEVSEGLTALSHLISIKLPLTRDAISVINRLERLRDVALIVRPLENRLISQTCFWKMIQSMTSLSLICQYGFPLFDPLMTVQLTQLELHKCSISRNSFDGLKQLRSLSLTCCHITEAEEILTRLVHLRRLSLRNVIVYHSKACRLSLRGQWVMHLRALVMDRAIVDWSANYEWTMPILEILCFHGSLHAKAKSVLFDRCLEQLPSLRHLGFQDESGFEDVWALMKTELLMRLESLCLDVQCLNTEVRRLFVQGLRHGPLSHLKIEFSLPVYLKEVMGSTARH